MAKMLSFAEARRLFMDRSGKRYDPVFDASMRKLTALKSVKTDISKHDFNIEIKVFMPSWFVNQVDDKHLN